MRRIAEFLEIELAEDLWPEIVEAAGLCQTNVAGLAQRC